MQLDQTKDPSFKNSRFWGRRDSRFQVFVALDPNNPAAGYISNSFSGGERNRMFLQSEDNFKEVTLFSGADVRDDGRGFSYFDFNQDGWLDLGITSPNEPRFRILRNNLGEMEPSKNRSVSLRFLGGNDNNKPNENFSAREAFGTSIVVTTGDTKRKFQYSCWEGLSSQNSPWMHVGIGTAEKIDRLDVTWPSGRKTTHTDVPASSKLTIRERDGEVAYNN